ncbi:MAG: ABC transporter ATP-binding protein [Propionibacteriaceae bacterium]|jgi:ABC-type multidrug transport system ATPase subunit|nr:ABC transporter ATP-binding protein [Propionibacteriaceae bacterium]
MSDSLPEPGNIPDQPVGTGAGLVTAGTESTPEPPEPIRPTAPPDPDPDQPASGAEQPSRPTDSEPEPPPVAPEPSSRLGRPAGIRTHQVKRAFGRVKAVDGVTFEAPAGAITALIGPNGSGKTTLLLILAGLLKPDSGSVQVAGFDPVLGNVELRSRVGWMPDAFGTWDTLTPLEILTTFARAYGLSAARGRQRAEQMLDQVHLTEFARSPARVLSRGQKQRLGLARALVHDPEALLLDEPASGLDPRSRVELRDTLRDLAQAGKTVLVSSHVLSELEEVYDHAVFLSHGRTVDPTPASERPASARGWRLHALDPASLRGFLDDAGVPWQAGSGASGEVILDLTGPESASQILRAAIAAGVPVHTIAPLSGRLEEAYLTLDEERK